MPRALRRQSIAFGMAAARWRNLFYSRKTANI